MRCLITSHPLYAEMLSLHAACLRVGTPVDQLPSIDAQLLQAPNITAKYSILRDQIAEISKEEQVDLDRFMVRILPCLLDFKKQLTMLNLKKVPNATGDICIKLVAPAVVICFLFLI